MNTEDIKKSATDLCWLAFLLTGDRDISIDIAADVVSENNSDTFFAKWLRGWQRRLVIGKALNSIHKELADSARRIAQARFNGSARLSRKWSLNPETTKADLERALLEIDLFPRAVVLLLLFEGVRMTDAVTLLDASPNLVKKAQAIALLELTVNLARMEPSAVSVRLSGIRH